MMTPLDAERGPIERRVDGNTYSQPQSREWQTDASIAFAKIILMQNAYADEMVAQRFEQILRQPRDAILLIFGATDDQLAILEIDVLHAKAQALHQPQPPL